MPELKAEQAEKIETRTGKGTSVLCTKCCVARLDAPDFDQQANPTIGEEFGWLCKVADARGWGWGSQIVNGQNTGIFICPACLKHSDEAANRILTKYTEKGKCSKCGNTNLGTKFCNGRVSTCELGTPRDHLHRICRRCGYVWIEGCLDDPKTTLSAERKSSGISNHQHQS